MVESKIDMLSGPVPGQSLTRAMGSRPYEQPPKYVHPEDAMYSILNTMTDPSMAAGVVEALDKGMYASDIANTILFGGVAHGKWTPDVAALLAKRTLGTVVAVGASQGLKNMKYKRPSKNPSGLNTFLGVDKKRLNRREDMTPPKQVVQSEVPTDVTISGAMGDN